MRQLSETVVFFGSGPVAAAALKLLVQDFAVEAVITKPLPPHHRGDFPVLTLAKDLNLPVFTPATKQALSELFLTKPVVSQVGVVIDYGIIISPDVIDYFPLGIVNSHFSLLPRWRGADPISFTILHGDRETGVSLMLIVPQLDEGPIFAQGACELPPDSTTPELTTELISLSHALLVDSLPKYVHGELVPRPQSEAANALGHSPEPTYSRKLIKDDGLIDWRQPAELIERQIRAFIEWPKSRTILAGKDVIITKAHLAGDTFQAPRDVSGTAFPTPDGLIGVATGQGVLVIDRLKPAGKPEMTAPAFLAGYTL
jgi:methionyl-tRNA formyltransferase